MKSMTEERAPMVEPIIQYSLLAVLIALTAIGLIFGCRRPRNSWEEKLSASRELMEQADSARIALEVASTRQMATGPLENVLLAPKPRPRPAPPAVAKKTVPPSAAPAEPQFELNGVMRWGPTLLATINNQVVAKGERIEGYRVLDIRPQGVTLLKPAGGTLNLSVFED